MKAIGNTSLIKLERLSEPGCADIYVKFEGANLTGSMNILRRHAITVKQCEIRHHHVYPYSLSSSLMARLKKIFTIVLIFLSANCFAQEKSGLADVSKVTFLNPGLSYEKKIAKFQTLYGQAYMSPSIYLGYSMALGDMSSIAFDPALALQYRYYYNFRSRADKGKRTEMNSLNYIAAVEDLTFSRNAISTSYFTETNRRPMHQFGVVWGLQRNRPKRFSIDFNIGLGYLYASSTSMDVNGKYVTTHEGLFTVLGQLTLGLWLNRKN